MYLIIFIHSSVDGHLDCFHVLAIVNSAAVNIGVVCIFSNYGFRDFPGGAAVKTPPANAGDTGSMPGPGRSHMLRSN